MLKIIMLKVLGLSLCGIILLPTVYAQKKVPPEIPKLVVGIVIDQMRYDYLLRYWNKFGDDGFVKLANQGVACRNAKYDYLLTQSAVGQATIFTGANPAMHGIVGKNWYMNLEDKKVFCVDDGDARTVGGSLEAGKFSPRKLVASTIGDELRLSNMKKSKTIGISLEGYGSILSAGHNASGAYWFDAETGGMVTSNFYRDTLPAWVASFNKKKLADFYLMQDWYTLLSSDQYKESMPDVNKFEQGFGKGVNAFPYDLNELRKKYKNFSLLKYTPYGNQLITDFANACIADEKLGKDDHPDILTLHYAVAENVSALFGPQSVEMQDIFLRLDKNIASLLKTLEAEVGKENFVVFLTAEHGAPYPPEYMQEMKIPTGSFNPISTISLLKSYLRAVYGQGEWIKLYADQQIFLNRTLIEDTKLSLEDVQNKTAQFLIQFSGVANVVTGYSLQTTSFANGIFRKFQNSYNQKRSGDLLINFEPGWVENENGMPHASYNYDAHVPLFWYGWKIKRRTINRPIDMTDIAPSISTILNISYPNSSTGSVIYELFE
jgi:predicted AlkP superfamily pyrophosphatase or phosphodiesterase